MLQCAGLLAWAQAGRGSRAACAAVVTDHSAHHDFATCRRRVCCRYTTSVTAFTAALHATALGIGIACMNASDGEGRTPVTYFLDVYCAAEIFRTWVHTES